MGSELGPYDLPWNPKLLGVPIGADRDLVMNNLLKEL